jgi:chorismate dehydratase
VETLRLFVVDFLNAWPLTWGLREDLPGVEVERGTPARCADALARGEADAGLLPVAAWARIPGLRIVPGLSVSCRGPVASVLLLARRPWRQVRTVALDASSRTSSELARLVMAWEGIEARTREAPPDLAAMLEEAEGALLIGDPALQADLSGLKVIDLGEAWWRRTGLPFVFAFWAVREGVDLAGRQSLLQDSAREGMRRRDDLVRHGAATLGLGEERVRTYLSENVRYDLGEPEREGLERFFGEMHRAGRLDGRPALRFLGEDGS